MSRHLIVSMCLGLLVLTGCPGPSNPQQGAAPAGPKAPLRSKPVQIGATGAELYQRTCAACHGPEGRGLPNLGKDLVASPFVAAQTDEQLLQFVKQGRAIDDPANTTKIAMPPKGGNPALKDEEIRSIITHIRGLAHQAPS